MPITATGIGTGLDVESLVAQLVLADVGPAESRLNSSEATYQAELSAYGVAKSALAAFQSTAVTASSASSYQGKTATTSLFSAVTATAANGALTGNYDIEVSSLATSQSLASGSFTTTTDVVGTGTLSIALGTTISDGGAPPVYSFTQQTGTTAVDVVIDSSNQTLSGVRDAINAAGAGVTASIVNDGSGYRMVLTSDATGAENSLNITVAGDGDGDNTNNGGLSRLAYHAADASARNLTENRAAADAAFSVNGLAITSASNSVTTAIDDMTFTLKEVTTAPVTIAVTDNIATAKSAVTGFVSAYNDVILTLGGLSEYDAELQTASVLTGDATLRTLNSSLRNLMNDSVANVAGTFSTLAELGITTTVLDGTLSVDDDALDAVLASDPLDVANVLASIGRPTDSNVKFLSSSSATVSGDYAVVVTDTSTAGSLTGLAATETDYQGGANNNATFTISVDGVSNEVTISSNNSNYAEVAADLESEINAAFGSSVVTVTESSGVFTITSATTGAASSVAITAVDAETAGLGLSVASGTAGVTSISATIDGQAATVNGTTITGATGTAAAGLQLQVLGGASGNLGTVAYGIGIGSQLDSLLTDLLATDGLVDARLTGITASIADITSQREALQLRATSLEALYRAQFNNLETLIAQLNTTQTFLNAALTNFIEPLSFRK
jgi:flagellar hook-associated protein 2